jgi:AcrR family transcriptional regulator
MSTTEHGRRGSGTRAIAPGREITPLYKRLPKGPHGIAPEDVVHHQRIRMHGAMIEAIATHGYERTSVKHVIGLAGVSRRAFYEQFTNKEDCFMETFDLIVNRAIKRVSGACRACAGPREKRIRAALRAFGKEIEANPKALSLVLIDALMAGPEGQLRLRRTMAVCEQLLASGLGGASAERPLPGPLVRAVVGGLRRATFVRLRSGRIESQSALSGEMLRWVLLFTSPAIATLRLRPSSRAPLPGLVQLQASPLAKADDRSRLLDSVVDIVLREPYEELSAPHIAEEAGLSIDTFLALFESPRQCFDAALDMLGGDLLETVADPELVSAEWPAAVCQAIDRLTAHVVTNPASTVTLAAKTFGAGLEAIEEMVRLSDEVATLLTEGAPRRARGKLATEMIAGALSHTLHTEVMAGRTHLLESLSEYLSYVVLAPFIGPEQAARAVVEARAKRAGAVGSGRAAAETGELAGALGMTAAASGAPPRSQPAAAAATEKRLVAPVGAPLGEVREHDADEQGDHDDDDERRMTRAEDPVDLDLFEVEDGEERDEHRQHHPRAGTRQFAS